MNYYKTYIIAEAGVNHNGSLDLAKKMVDVAVTAGIVQQISSNKKGPHEFRSYYSRKNR